MSTYAGMSLSGEVRESISLDEDDLSDVEDEVFIRDGKNSYKLAEELNMKRPLMAPRKKLGRTEFTTRLKNRPPCRALCKPCCYIFAALSTLIGVIILIVILVSLFPLPLDRFRDWILAKSIAKENSVKLIPCSNLGITDVWSINLPILTTDSPVRTLDINEDGVEDIIFGFGTGDNYDILPPELFCPIFLDVPPPCEGGLLALNGLNGSIIWRYWINDTIFSIQCETDLNLDGNKDCLAVGTEGTILAINPRNGSLLWIKNSKGMEVYLTNLVPDQDNDTVTDILASHVLFDSQESHLVMISGKTGMQIKKINLPYQTQTFFMPQLLHYNNSLFVLVGTGSPGSPGNLSIIDFTQLLSGNVSFHTIYSDHHKGVLTQSVLVDITGDNVTDIVTAMFNSTVVAIDGKTFDQIWNYTVPDAETNVIPTPAYFNEDNVTDFLITYEKYDSILSYNYTVTYILNGKTGKPIYGKPISGRVSTQETGLTLQMESYGFDMFVLWRSECISTPRNENNLTKNVDLCPQQLKASKVLKLNALNQFDQPPGFEIYNSINKTYLEFASPLRRIRTYMQNHYSGSTKMNSFNRDENPAIQDDDIDNYMRPDTDSNEDIKYYSEPLSMSQGPLTPNYETVDVTYDQDNSYKANREMRSQDERLIKQEPTAQNGIYNYANIKMSRNRLLHDLNNLPSVILRDTFYKNEENKLKKSKFEQRDIMSHMDKSKEKQEVKKAIEDERKNAENSSFNLWDLESEKEMQDKENGYWRGKREFSYLSTNVPRVTSVGAILPSFNSTNNSLDIVFITYWEPSKAQYNIFKEEIEECVNEEMGRVEKSSLTVKEQEKFYRTKCTEEQEDFKKKFQYAERISQLSLGSMTVYRLRIECLCNIENSNERCVNFLPINEQNWSSYLGKLGNGFFHTRD